jgi:uncharacterized protein YecT (DUF1311 family)
MKLVSTIVPLVAVVMAAQAAHAASFDCGKAQRPAEKAICSDAKLSAADSALAAAYGSDRSRISSRMIGTLRVDQLQWLAWVQTVCVVGKGGRSPADAAKCMGPLYDDRLKQLRLLVNPLGGLNFVTRTQFLAAPIEAGGPPVGQPEFPGFGTVRASWPEADTEDETWAAWNKAVALEARSMAAGTNREASRAADDWDRIVSGEADLTVWSRVKSVEHDRATVGFNVEGMMHGGAHPYEAWESMIWLLDKGRIFGRGDLFADGSAWRAALSTACWQQLQQWTGKTALYETVKGPDTPVLQQVVSDPRNWTLEKDGLHISYPEYTVSPRYATPDDAVVPWVSLKGLLVDGFVLP